jgi:hypothetical protein
MCQCRTGGAIRAGARTGIRWDLAGSSSAGSCACARAEGRRAPGCRVRGPRLSCRLVFAAVCGSRRRCLLNGCPSHGLRPESCPRSWLISAPDRDHTSLPRSYRLMTLAAATGQRGLVGACGPDGFGAGVDTHRPRVHACRDGQSTVTLRGRSNRREPSGNS